MAFKKLIAAVLCAALVLCIAACGKAPATNNPAGPAYSGDSAPSGVLFVSIGAEYKVIYDSDGLVVAVDSIEESSEEIINAYLDAVGSPCDTVISQLIKRTVEAEQHGSARVVVLKQAPDSGTPSAKFLEDIRIDAAAATDFEVVMISAKELTAEGYISADSAKDILTRQLKLVDVTITCSEAEENVYTLTFEQDGDTQEYEIDALTGSVYMPLSVDDLGDPTDFENPVSGDDDMNFDVPEDEPVGPPEDEM